MTIVPSDVFAWIDADARIFNNDASALMQKIIEAVESHWETHFEVPDADPRPAHIDLALKMQAGRLWKRRQTPEGVQGVADFGVIRVTRFDPDIDDLLADYMPIGIA